MTPNGDAGFGIDYTRRDLVHQMLEIVTAAGHQKKRRPLVSEFT